MEKNCCFNVKKQGEKFFPADFFSFKRKILTLFQTFTQLLLEIVFTFQEVREKKYILQEFLKKNKNF